MTLSLSSYRSVFPHVRFQGYRATSFSEKVSVFGRQADHLSAPYVGDG